MLPATFVRRGMAIHCTTGLLKFARVRSVGSDKYELIVPAVEVGQKSYVIPVQSVSNVMTLSVHDRAMFEELNAVENPSPITLRMLMLRVNETGLGGPGLIKTARKELELDAVESPHVFAELMARALHRLAGNAAAARKVNAEFLETQDGRNFCAAALADYAGGIETTGEDAVDRLRDWAEVIASAGIPLHMLKGQAGDREDENDRIDGYVGRLMQRMEEFSDALTSWLLSEPHDTAELAERSAVAARKTVEHGIAVTASIDASLDDMNETLSRWWAMRRDFSGTVDRLAYTVDGWSRIVDFWDGIQKADRFDQREVLEQIAQNLPILPQEAAGEDAAFWRDLRERQARWGDMRRRRVGAPMDQDTRDKLERFEKEPV